MVDTEGDTVDTEGDRADTEGDITVTSADFLGFIIAAGLTDVERSFTEVNGTSATFMDFVYDGGLVDTGLTNTEAGITVLSTGGTEDFARVEVDFEGSMDNLRLLFGGTVGVRKRCTLCDLHLVRHPQV